MKSPAAVVGRKTGKRRTAGERKEQRREEAHPLAQVAGKYEGAAWEELRAIMTENRRQLDSFETPVE